MLLEKKGFFSVSVFKLIERPKENGWLMFIIAVWGFCSYLGGFFPQKSLAF